MQRRHGVFAQQGGQRGLVGPVAVQAAAHRQTVGIGKSGAVGSGLQQGVAAHRQGIHTVGLIVRQQQGGGAVAVFQLNVLRGAVCLQGRSQRGVGTGVQRLRRREGDFLHRAGGHRRHDTAPCQQHGRRQHSYRLFDRSHGFVPLCRAEFFIFLYYK